MRISDEAIRQVKAATKVVDVLSDFVKLYKRGVNYVALCPFHDDKNYGNFVVSPNKIFIIALPAEQAATV